jgi:hypothetical protein
LLSDPSRERRKHYASAQKSKQTILLAYFVSFRAPFAVSSTGVLAYQAGATVNLGLVWFDRATRGDTGEMPSVEVIIVDG